MVGSAAESSTVNETSMQQNFIEDVIPRLFAVTGNKRSKKSQVLVSFNCIGIFIALAQSYLLQL